MPQPMAVSLWLAVSMILLTCGCAAARSRRSLEKINCPVSGKAQPFRTVLRQSRNLKCKKIA